MARNAVLESDIVLDANLFPSIGLLEYSTDQVLKNFGQSGGRRIVKLVSDGAKLEDKLPRPLKHFFDPINNIGYQSLNPPSPDWALEDDGDIADQQYSLKDAYDALYGAMTLADASARETHYIVMFETLGRVIHHPQDMAQPQHTRNDPHFTIEALVEEEQSFERRSRYERFSNLVKDSLDYTSQVVNMDKYHFNSARAYWTTPDNKGMADFSNANFVSHGTNFQFRNGAFSSSCRYDLPVPNSSIEVVSFQDVFNDSVYNEQVPPEIQTYCDRPDTNCNVGFLKSTIIDNLLTDSSGAPLSVENPRAAVFSIFDEDLKVNPQKISYTDVITGRLCESDGLMSLNRLTFAEAHKYLIPRSVAYSAGLINYFFRGRLSTVDVEHQGNLISFKVRNGIDSEKWPEHALSAGELTVTVSYQYQGQSYVAKSFNAGVFSETLLPGKVSSSRYSFTLPGVPADATDIQYRVIYKGAIGPDTGAVAFGYVAETALLAWTLVADGASEYEMWRSVDYGKTWEVVFGPAAVGRPGKIKPIGVGKALAFSGKDNSIFITEDAGKTWRIYLSMDNNTPFSEILRYGYLWNSTYIGNRTLVSFRSQSGGISIVYSYDNGSTWDNPESQVPGVVGANAVIYLGKRKMLLLGLECLTAECSFTQRRRVHYLSEDGGKTWALHNYPTGDIYLRFTKAVGAQGLIGEQFEMVPSGMFSQTSVWITKDFTKTWAHKKSLVIHGSYPQSYLFHMGYMGDGVIVLYIIDDISSTTFRLSTHGMYEAILLSTDNGVSWTEHARRSSEPGSSLVNTGWPRPPISPAGVPFFEMSAVSSDPRIADIVK